MPRTSDFLKEIRDEFDSALDAMRYIREQGDIDMRFLANDGWDQSEKIARKEAGRPILSLDIVSQYTMQVTNSLLQNKRDVQVNPIGDGANDETARFTSNMIRQIHYESQADDAHMCAVENAVNRSYGAWGLKTEYSDSDSFEQKLVVRRFPNPNAVLWDLDCKQADFSDMRFAFVLDSVRRKTFKETWPKADVHNFTTEHMQMAPRWIQDDHIQIAEYWQVKEVPRKLLMLEVVDPATGKPQRIHEDELPDGARVSKDEGGKNILILPSGNTINVLMKRPTTKRVVTQYITNGVEILEENPWAGSWIPIFPVIGKELYVDLGGGSRRIWLSLIRHARDAQMLFNYYKTCQAEVVGMAPKTKWVMYEGQIEGHEAEWQNANRNPITALQVKPTLDATGAQVLPLPQRQDYEPPIQNLEVGAQSAAKAVQSATAMYNSSIGNNDTNVKSGVAIEKLDRQSDVATFHFTAALDRALMHAGRCEDELIPIIYDTDRQVGVRDREGNYQVHRINAKDENGNPVPDSPQIKPVKHAVTMSVGPSLQSERESAAAFVDRISEVPGVFEKIGDLLVKLKNLGPIGEEIAARITPPEYANKDPQQVPQLQTALKQAQQMISELQGELQKLTLEKQAKVIETQGSLAIAQLKAEVDKYKSDLQALVAAEKITSDENLSFMQHQLTAVIQKEMAELEAKLNPKPEPAGAAK